MRAGLLPQLEREHDHGRVAAEDMERRLAGALSRSHHTPRALLLWQTRGRGHPCLLPLMRAPQHSRQPAPTHNADPAQMGRDSAAMTGSVRAAQLARHNMLARAHWALTGAAAARAPREGYREGYSERERCAVRIQAAWRGHAGRRAAATERARRVRPGPAADLEEQRACAAAVRIQTAYRGWSARRLVAAAVRAASSGHTQAAPWSGEDGHLRSSVSSIAEDDEVDGFSDHDVERWVTALAGAGATFHRQGDHLAPHEEEREDVAPDQDSGTATGAAHKAISQVGIIAEVSHSDRTTEVVSRPAAGRAMQHHQVAFIDDDMATVTQQLSDAGQQARDLHSSGTRQTGQQQSWAPEDTGSWSSSAGNEIGSIDWEDEDMEDAPERVAPKEHIRGAGYVLNRTNSDAMSGVSTCSDAAPSDTMPFPPVACSTEKPNTQKPQVTLSHSSTVLCTSCCG